LIIKPDLNKLVNNADDVMIKLQQAICEAEFYGIFISYELKQFVK